MKRPVLRLASLLAALLPALLSASPPMLVYIGTFTPSPPHHGVFAATFDAETGHLSQARPVASAQDPSFLALSPRGTTLFSSAFTADGKGRPVGQVRSFAVDRKSGALTPLSEQPNGTEAACHISLSPDGATLFAANYMNGFAASFPVSDSGEIEAVASRIQHLGTGTHPSRQEAPHVHGVTASPDGRFVFAPDLGLDRVVAYRVGPQGTLTPAPELDLVTPPGQGPRHVTFSPDGRFLYEIDELVACVRAYRYEPTTGKAEFLQQIPTLPSEFKGQHSGAEIQVHPSGRWLYASNREDHQSIAVFAIDAATGHLTFVQSWQPGLVHPRFITVDPSGRWLVIANTFGDHLVTAPIDLATGRLGAVASRLDVPRPSCVVFVRE